VAFSFLKNLRHIFLEDNPKLNLLRAFQGLRDVPIETMSLGRNNLNEIPVEALTIVASSLQRLDLHDNSFRDLRPEHFPYMPAMREINLRDCNIRSIAEGTLDNMPQLSSLTLLGNYLEKVPACISSLPSLINLDLSYNPRTKKPFEIPQHTFSNHSRLRVLFLNNVNLGRVEQHTFTGLTNLVTLSLADSKINYIADKAFSSLGSLRVLQMGKNPLSHINSLTFYGMSSLTDLFLDNCLLQVPMFEGPSDGQMNNVSARPIFDFLTSTNALKDAMEEEQEIPNASTPFAHLIRLKFIDLSYNRMRFLFYELFKNSPYLTHVDLANNRIESWSDRVFYQRELSEIMISNNKIGPVTSVMVEDLTVADYHAKSVLDLGNNPFLCCQGGDLLQNLSQISTVELVGWNTSNCYTCFFSENQTYHHLEEFSSEFCTNRTSGLPETDPWTQEEQESTSWLLATVYVASALFCAGVLTTVVYKNRMVVKYWLFNFKLEMGKEEDRQSSEFEYDVFVSYHHEDTGFLSDHLVPQIEQEKDSPMKLCIHERDFEAGVPITENIIRCVDTSAKIVMVVSQKYLESQWCQFEMKLAYHRLIERRRKCFLVILLEPVPPQCRSKVLNYLLSSRTYIEWPGTEGSVAARERFWVRFKTFVQSA